MLTTERAAPGTTISELMYAHIQGYLKPIPPSTPEDVKEIITRCLMLNPQARYADWEQVEDALGRAYQLITRQIPPSEKAAVGLEHAERLALGWAHNALGASYIDLDMVESAQGYIERAKAAGIAEHDRELEAVGLLNIGTVNQRLGEFQQAIGFFEQALKIARETEDIRVYGGALNNLGYTYQLLGEMEQSIKYCEQSLTISRKLIDRNGEAGTLINLGVAYKNLGDARRAIGYYEQALSINQELNNRKGKIACLLGLV